MRQLLSRYKLFLDPEPADQMFLASYGPSLATQTANGRHRWYRQIEVCI
jgi:hypothetical protein